MHRIVTNKYRFQNNGRGNNLATLNPQIASLSSKIVPRNAKLLAWGLFLFFFIENATLGLLPRQFYMVYRNVRISDLILYFLVAYSLYCAGEYKELLKSKALLITNILLIYIFIRFLASVMVYQVNLIEFFFRLKFLWESFLVFPFLLLFKRKGFDYLIKIIIPVAVVSNILYIITATTGVALLPEVGIYKQELPGGLEVYRVYGGTFYGDLCFLGIIYLWISQRFKVYQLFLAILFALPHILAFGRTAWAFQLFVILTILIWNMLKKRGFKVLIRQIVLLAVFFISLSYLFTRIVPEPGYMMEALQTRVFQGQEDVKYTEGTYGSRMAAMTALIDYWYNTNVFFGIGMHPFWVIAPATTEEEYYSPGFNDLGWAPVLVSYGLIGFLLCLFLQLYYLITSFRVLKKSQVSTIFTFLILVLIARLLFDSLYYTMALISFSFNGFSGFLFLYIAALVYEYENTRLNSN